MLEVVNLSKKYGKMLAVDDVGFTVPDGRIGILLGPNGAGKTTTLQRGRKVNGHKEYCGTFALQGEHPHPGD